MLNLQNFSFLNLEGKFNKITEYLESLIILNKFYLNKFH